MQAALLAKLSASPPVVGSYAEPDPVPEPVEPTEEEAAEAAAKKDEFIAAKKAEAEAPVEEGADPAPEFDEAAAVAGKFTRNLQLPVSRGLFSDLDACDYRVRCGA